MLIEVLRLSHRLPRDERISTHVALVARAFGAGSVAYTGQHDQGLEDSVERICARWGAKAQDGSGKPFSIRYEKSAIQVIKSRKREGFSIVHLTMYGMPLMSKAQELMGQGKILIVVGSDQVPREIYELADFNVSVTSQPHSEVAALAIALDRLSGGRELIPADFSGQISIAPSEKGKDVREKR